MPSSTSDIDHAVFDVTCPKCGAKVPLQTADARSHIPCPACNTTIDLATDEVKHARQAAAAKASIQANQPADTQKGK